MSELRIEDVPPEYAVVNFVSGHRLFINELDIQNALDQIRNKPDRKLVKFVAVEVVELAPVRFVEQGEEHE